MQKRTRSRELALCAVGAAGGRLEGGAPCASVRGLQDAAPFLPLTPVLGGCGRDSRPSIFVALGYGPGGPSPTPQRTLLRAGSASYGGSVRAPRWRGAPRGSARDVRGCALCLLRPVCGGCGWCGRGGSSAISQRTLLRAGVLCRAGGRGGGPESGGGAPRASVRGVLRCATFFPLTARP